MSSLPTGTNEKPATTENASTQPPRKRRRRAVATGASEDCFACRKRQTKCDRRRPYCTQCIDLGKECSGYRTTLTWGVGVASRGKLRGLSLPVAKSPKAPSAGRDSKGPSSAVSKDGAREAARSSQVDHGRTNAPSSPFDDSFGRRAHEDIPIAQFHGTSPIPVPMVPSPHMGWHVPGFHEHVDACNALHGKPSRPNLPPRPLQKLHTAIGPFDDTSLSASTGSVSGFSDHDFPSPSEFPHTPGDIPYDDPFFPRYPSYFLPHGMPEMAPHAGTPRSYPSIGDDMSSSISSDQSIYEYTDASPVSAMGPMSSSGLLFDEVVTAQPDDSRSYAHGPDIDQTQLELTTAMPQEVSAAGAVDAAGPLARTLTFLPAPRIQFLLDYYNRAICPVLVAFDGPANPYRMYILSLALQNEALQNAIAALAINNMRMRGLKEASGYQRADSLFEKPMKIESTGGEMTPEEMQHTHSKPTGEELHYKATSIKQLNSQLLNGFSAKDDSVLATLLVLCLFHACDSGFSKFKTQLAGVQKLLSMRSKSNQSGFIGWIEMFFTWFDVMTSTVNDREGQIRGDTINLTDFSANLGALEHLSGCEGRLFKIIARLGRLNLLSQNRPVSERVGDSLSRPPVPPKPAAFPWDQLDGNGWGTPISNAASDSLDPDDLRSEFWNEWHDIRKRLQEWEMDPPALTSESPDCTISASSPTLTPAQRDLVQISESFRSAALLYTERLAHPSTPSSALNIQNLVAQTLYHVSQIGITSCVNKFLLWPLFIAGAECVDEAPRALVRKRCVEIQRESGFFNNLSGLEVLERVWRDDDAAAAGDGKGFKWRKAMNRVDGEYIIV